MPYFSRSVALASTLTILVLGGLSFAQSTAEPPKGPGQESQDPATIRVDVDLVNILFTVKAKKGGQLIPNLEKNNFSISEDGKSQTIQRFSRETDLPLTLGLLIDVSASQERLIETEREAAAAFFSRVLRKKDEAFLISFGKSTELLQDFTNSAKQLTSAMRDLQGAGQAPMIGRNPVPVNTGPVPTVGSPKGTLLYDAVYLASDEKLKGEVGRKALILIADGEDQGSTYKIKTAIEQAQKADAIIYSLYYVDHAFYSRGMMSFGGGGEGQLRKMSEETGGHVFTVSSKHPLKEVLDEIQEELRNQYSIGYSSTNPKKDGSFRRIEIKTDHPDYHVQARNGYYATPVDTR